MTIGVSVQRAYVCVDQCGQTTAGVQIRESLSNSGGFRRELSAIRAIPSALAEMAGAYNAAQSRHEATFGAACRLRRGIAIRRTLDGVARSAWVVNVPHWTEVPDHFVWNVFAALSRDARHRLVPDASQQEALLAHTTNFYVIPDQFGVVDGHLLVLPKQPATSVACLDPSLDDEIIWLLERVSKVVANAYEAGVVIAEHGECGCVTNGQAHIHVLPIPKTVAKEDLTSIIDDVLTRRMAGIESIAYRDAAFMALEDLQSLLDVRGAKVFGEQLSSTGLKMSGIYPAEAREVTGLVRPYVYFRGPGVEFLTLCSLGSQFVREVVARATGVLDESWNRRTNPDRTNMFATFAVLASAFADSTDVAHGFRPRSQAERRQEKRMF